MYKLYELIDKLCPDGVEYKTLGEVIKTVTPPKKLTKKEYLTEGKYPIIDQGQDFFCGYINNECVILPKEEYILFGDHTEYFKYYNDSFAQGADGLKIITVDTKFIDTKFLYYELVNFYKCIGGYNRHWKYLIKIKVPVPPIDIQQEIVKILDTFADINTGLLTELQAELKNRKV